MTTLTVVDENCEMSRLSDGEVNVKPLKVFNSIHATQILGYTTNTEEFDIIPIPKNY